MLKSYLEREKLGPRPSRINVLVENLCHVGLRKEVPEGGHAVKNAGQKVGRQDLAKVVEVSRPEAELRLGVERPGEASEVRRARQADGRVEERVTEGLPLAADERGPGELP